MKDSIDYAIANAKNYGEFLQILKNLEYIITDKQDTLSIRREPYKRNTRIERQFGKQYSKEAICRRILETQPEYIKTPEPYLLAQKRYNTYYELIDYSQKNNSPLILLFLIIMKLLLPNMKQALKTNPTKITPELIHAIKQMDEYSNQARFLAKNKLHSEEQLIQFEKELYEKIAPLKSERENLWRKHKKAKTSDEKDIIEKRIVEISKEITPLTDNIKFCKSIQKRIEKIKITKFNKMLLKKEQEPTKNKIKYMNKER